ncbi:hypothetical protein BAY61_08415 [Prauserella marina]|uniref:ATP-dependent Clp protease ATP-binding subunit ClpC n=1 Tax=Prauserella marina TaxID=530584 RepID=A0A222VMQ4_9PSEU|nr:Clp protease N-terminal domain-containing protein [Prauserella marina]ASR35001.1 hypothetical protein BAY61_08415 [Prauserella marina]PWV85269.1 ATP-dependent Clp protease ATP-binding subunit ClpC [Prauserella marina]SDC00937.1 ATP-dependent Clp protease ATP-binding subunit ClpC [Prauserella marina]
MPKINVYLPDELADAVKTAGIPVSAICQRALEHSVKRVSAIRARALDDPASVVADLSQFTGRSRTALTLGIDKARAEGAREVGTEHLLAGLLAEGENLGLRVLGSLDVEVTKLTRELERRAGSGTGTNEGAERFGALAAAALELAATEALTMGHNYIGCEHLLLGLLAEPSGTAGQLLRAHGAELKATRGAVTAALAGYLHGNAQRPGTEAESVLRHLLDRISRIEDRIGMSTSDTAGAE